MVPTLSPCQLGHEYSAIAAALLDFALALMTDEWTVVGKKGKGKPAHVASSCEALSERYLQDLTKTIDVFCMPVMHDRLLVSKIYL